MNFKECLFPLKKQLTKPFFAFLKYNNAASVWYFEFEDKDRI